MATRLSLWILVAASTSTAAAQVPAPPAKPEARLEPIVLTVYDEAESRRCFTALDADADDRLSVFEVARAFEESAGPSDPTLLRSLDLDRDGFVDWAEFDIRVRNAVRLHGLFRCRPARLLSTASTEARPAKTPLDAPTRALLDLTDTDGSDTLSPDEFTTLVLSVGLPPSTAEQFGTFDRDKSGALDPDELRPLTPIVATLLTRRSTPSPAKAFSGSWAAADRNHDGEVDAAELAAALSRHDPFLGRWARTVIEEADRGGNGKLGPAEVLAEEQRRTRDAKAPVRR